jgi:N-methylhydantoinase A
MEEEGRALLLETGADPGQITALAAADMRHVGQGFEIPVKLPSMKLSAADLPAIRESFFASYRERFGRALTDLPIEALSWRVACLAPGRDIQLAEVANTATESFTDAARAARGMRDVLFEGIGWLPCQVYDRYALAPGASFMGPALVEERESTCVIGPEAKVSVDSFRNLVVELP